MSTSKLKSRIQKRKAVSSLANKKISNTKWRTIIGLILMYVIILMDWQWAWGILFLIWVIPDLFRGTTYFIEPIDKAENAWLYWVIVISWIWMALISLSTLFFNY